MKKYELSRKGVESFQQAIAGWSNERRTEEALALASDSLGWIARYFEFDVRQFEQLRRTPEPFRRVLGWYLAATVESGTSAVIGFLPENDTLVLSLGATCSYNCKNGDAKAVINLCRMVIP